jgi:hypothetical protein
LLPVKIGERLAPLNLGDGSQFNRNFAILTLVLALALPIEKAIPMIETLLSLGVTSSQADTQAVTAFHRYIQVRYFQPVAGFGR